jgi:hypothetical protein
MNNSLPRLIDGMVSTLRQEVIPHITGDFARGQAFGVIYMLNSLRLRTDWSRAFVLDQISAQVEFANVLKTLVVDTTAPPLPQGPSTEMDLRALEALRTANDAAICDWIDWKAMYADILGADRAHGIEAALRACMDCQLKHELQTSAKPMFAEISAGAE